ncbi:MAG: ubiquinol-cytochrome C chaperone family protein [Hyphomonadaceae bacterium]
MGGGGASGAAFMLGQWFKRRRRNRWAVDRLHQSIQSQALRPEFYFDGGVRDNFSGRFEMTALLATLVLRRLRELGGAGRDMAQDVFGALFSGFDEALRDIGTGDLTVGKKIRRMGEAFYGRARAYEEALAQTEGAAAESGEAETGQTVDDLLARVLSRNLGVDETHQAGFAAYVRAVDQALSRHPEEQMLAGEIRWPRFSVAVSRSTASQNQAGAVGR